MDLLRYDSRGRWGWWCSSRGCGDISFIVCFLFFSFFILIQAVQSRLPGDLHYQLIVRLDHFFMGGLLLLQPLSVIPQSLA
jgi:hypothetical protein